MRIRPQDLHVSEDLAERIEQALTRAGGRGASPATAARRARCTTAQARAALWWLEARQFAHTGGRGRRSHYYPGRPC